MPIIPIISEAKIGGSQDQASLSNLVRPCLSQILKGCGCSSLVECLPSTCMALGSVRKTRAQACKICATKEGHLFLFIV